MSYLFPFNSMLLTLSTILLVMWMFPSILIGFLCKVGMLLYIVLSLGAWILGPNPPSLSLKSKHKSPVFQPVHLYSSYAIVTGSSTGIGKEIAKNLAKQGFNLLLVSEPNDKEQGRLQQLADEIKFKNSRISITSLGINLASMDGPNELIHRVQQLGLEDKVDIMVNNAGVGATSYFIQTDYAELENLVHLDVVTLTKLSHYWLNKFVERGRGRLLNVGSIVGFVPGPRAATYCAAKSYVNNLTLSLQYETEKLCYLKRKADPAAPTDVSITLAAFGPVPDTKYGERGHSSDIVFFKHAKPNIISAARAGYEAVNGLLLNQPVVMPAIANRFMTAIFQILPDHVRNLINDYHWGTDQDLKDFEQDILDRFKPLTQGSSTLYNQGIHYSGIVADKLTNSSVGQKVLNSDQWNNMKERASGLSEKMKKNLDLSKMKLPQLQLPEKIKQNQYYQKYIGSKEDNEESSSSGKEENQSSGTGSQFTTASAPMTSPDLSSYKKPLFHEETAAPLFSVQSEERPINLNDMSGEMNEPKQPAVLFDKVSVFDAAKDNRLNFSSDLIAEKTQNRVLPAVNPVPDISTTNTFEQTDANITK